MRVRARTVYLAAALLAGLCAAALVMVFAGRARREERERLDLQAGAQLAAAFEARLDAIARAVRGPAVAFELQTLAPREVIGVLRLCYAQSDAVAAVTMLDREGNPLVPAVFVPRAGGPGGAHPPESLDDLSRFAVQIPHAASLARGRAVRGPYAVVRGNGARLAIADTLPVAQGTTTWVLATELDAARLLELGGLASMVSDADVAMLARGTTVGTLARLPDDARNAIRAAALARLPLRGVRTLRSGDWRAVLAPAPAGLEGVLVAAWIGEDARERRARNADLALAVLVLSVIAAMGAVMFVATPTTPTLGAQPNDAGGEARVLGVVVRELSNPIAATTAAARLLSQDPGKTSLVETVARSALRVERAFRRLSRLARANEESRRTDVDLVALVRREVQLQQAEYDKSELSIELTVGDEALRMQGDEEDLAMLVEALLDGARAVAPSRSKVCVRLERAERGVLLGVRDGGRLQARDRLALTRLEEGTRTEGAASSLAWALASRIARDHGGTIDAADVDGGVEVRVRM